MYNIYIFWIICLYDSCMVSKFTMHICWCLLFKTNNYKSQKHDYDLFFSQWIVFVDGTIGNLETRLYWGNIYYASCATDGSFSNVMNRVYTCYSENTAVIFIKTYSKRGPDYVSNTVIPTRDGASVHILRPGWPGPGPSPSILIPGHHHHRQPRPRIASQESWWIRDPSHQVNASRCGVCCASIQAQDHVIDWNKWLRI